MPQTLLEIAKELTLTLVEAGRLSSEDMHDALQKTHATLLTLKVQEETDTTASVPVSETPRARIDWRKSITHRAISCLECGRSLKQLAGHHLRLHGLDARSYRAKYGIPRTASLTARQATARRREIVRQTRPWENAPTFLKGKERVREEETAAEAARAASEAAPAPTAEVSPLTRGRKTAPKKTARK